MTFVCARFQLEKHAGVVAVKGNRQNLGARRLGGLSRDEADLFGPRHHIHEAVRHRKRDRQTPERADRHAFPDRPRQNHRLAHEARHGRIDGLAIEDFRRSHLGDDAGAQDGHLQAHRERFGLVVRHQKRRCA